jgi:hypothetical protein
MSLQQSGRNRRTGGEGAARWRRVVACAALALGAALASCANGGSDAEGPGDGAATGAETMPAGEDSGSGLGARDATSPDEDTGEVDGSVGTLPRDSEAADSEAADSEAADSEATDSEATDSGTAPPPVDGATLDGSKYVDGSMQDAGAPVDASPPVDAKPPADTGGGGTDASGAHDAGSCGGWPPWVEGTTAQQVQNMGERYTCIQPGWCDQTGTSAVLAWEPGVGSDWQAAWQDSGPCP